MAKLGSDTGSLVNYMAMNSKNTIVPEVGMGVTFYSWSDRDPGTIREIKVIRDRIYIRITRDEYIRIDNNGFSEAQEYEFTTVKDNGSGVWYRQTKDKNNWERVVINQDTGRWVKSYDSSIRIGHREKYHDFTF